MVRSAAPPRASTSEKANFSYLIAENYQQHSTRTRGGGGFVCHLGPGTPEGRSERTGGPPSSGGFRSSRVRSAGRASTSTEFIYKSVELVSNPRTTHDLSDPSLRDGGAYALTIRTRGQTMASGDDRDYSLDEYADRRRQWIRKIFFSSRTWLNHLGNQITIREMER